MRQSHAKLGSVYFWKSGLPGGPLKGVFTRLESISLHTLAVSICEMCFVSDALIKINSVRLCMGLWEKAERGHDFKPIGQVSHNQANVESEACRFLRFYSITYHQQNDPIVFFKERHFGFFIFIFCVVKLFTSFITHKFHLFILLYVYNISILQSLWSHDPSEETFLILCILPE